MPDRDYVGDILQVSYKGVFDFDGLYKSLCGWFKKHRYTFNELDYKEFKERGERKLHVKWEGKRRVTDYVVYTIEVGFQLNDYADVKVKNKKRVGGDLGVKIIAYLAKDYEETWSRKSWLKFIREIYDRFVIGGKNLEMQNELLGEMKILRNEIKAFLNLQKLKK